MSVIKRLQLENEQLRAEKEQTERDMAFVAKTAKKTWDDLGFDFPAVEPKNGKASMADIAKIAFSVGRKLMSGKIKINSIVQEWDKVQPVLKKYEHVINKDDKL